MTEIAPNETKTDAAAETRRKRSLAMSLTLVAALFSGAVMGAMVATHFAEPAPQAGKPGTPPTSPTIESLRAALAKDPANEALKDALRQEDQRTRQDFFTHRRRIATGAYLLLVGLAATVICARWYASLDRKTPKPSTPAEREDAGRWLAQRRRNLIGVAAICAVVLAGFAIFALAGGPGLPATGEAAAPKIAPPVAPPTPTASEFKENWPRFRGPDGTGVVKSGEWPRTWDAETGENIVWKSPVPMPGNSSPVLWGDRLFLTGADADRQEAVCYSRASGKLLWRTQIFAARGNVKAEDITVSQDMGNNYASPTAAADGERVYVTYASADVAAVDFNGNVAWARNLGKPESVYGRATSLLVWKDKLIVQFDCGTGPEDALSSMLALDARTGRTVWTTPRAVRQCWSTPVLMPVGGHTELIANGSPWIIAYDPETGGELWRCGGMGEDTASSPTFADGLVYVANENAAVFAIRPGGRGDVTQTNVAWRADDGMPDASSPVCDGRFYLQATSSGRITCFDAKSGQLLWDKPLGGTIWASPTLAGNTVYVPGENGKVYVFELADKLGPIATCDLGEPLRATPAFADGRIYFRGSKTLFCVGAPVSK